MCLSVSRTGTQKDSRSLFGKRVAYCLFSLKAFFFGGRGKAYQSDEVGKIKLEQQTKLKLKTIEKID